jgi:hypothetical protein
MKEIGTAVLTLFAATVTMAQTKISGTVVCSKADQKQSMEVGDPRKNRLLYTTSKRIIGHIRG